MLLKTCSNGWTNERKSRRRTLGCRRTRPSLSAREDLARAHPATPDPGVADAERFRAGRRPPFRFACRLGRRRLPGAGGRAGTGRFPIPGRPWGWRASSPGHLRRPAPERICAWNRRASGRIRNVRSRAPLMAGNNSWRSSTRFWRERSEAVQALRGELGEMSHPPQTPRRLWGLVLMTTGGVWGGMSSSPPNS